jgi:hypothetical protein
MANLSVVEGDALDEYLRVVSDAEIADAREAWDEYSSRPGLFDAELNANED